jgi:hypothetical protein
MRLIILSIADAVLVKTPLPERPSISRSRPHCVRESSLDALNAPFERLLGRRRDKEVKVVRHNDERMQSISLLIAIVDENLA